MSADACASTARGECERLARVRLKRDCVWAVPAKANCGAAGAGPGQQSCYRLPSAVSPQNGFTLLEIMVVILIMGVMVTFASLSIGSRINEDKLENEVRRAEAIIRLASEEAEARGIEIGLRFSEGGYRLLVLDSSKHWQDYELSGPLRRRRFEAPFVLNLRVDGRPVRLPPELTPEQERELAASVVLKSERDNDAQRLTPQILLLSSGEITAFNLLITAPGVVAGYQIEADAFGRIQRTRAALANAKAKI